MTNMPGAGSGGGGGGGGGSGLAVRANNTTITVTSAQGGNGGNGGTSGTPGRRGGAGSGIYINGTGNTVHASGTIAPGTGATTADAINMASGINTVELTAATVNGSVRTLGVAGNTLRGTGTINGDVLLGAGSIAPGHSIGTMTMAFLDLRGGVYNAEIDAGASTSDLIHVNGPASSDPSPRDKAAWIDGATLNISNLGGTPAAGQAYTLLTATHGIYGSFTLGTLPTGVTGTLSYPTLPTPSVVFTITAAPLAAGSATAIPTLSTWGLGALSLLLAGGAFWARRRTAGQRSA